MCFSKTVKAAYRLGAAKTDFQAEVEILADGAEKSAVIRFDVDSGADISGVTESQYKTFFSAAPRRPVLHQTYNFDGSLIPGIDSAFRCVLYYGDKVWLT